MIDKSTSLKYLVSISKGKKPRFEIDEFKEGLIPYLSMDVLRGKNVSPIYVDEVEDNIVRVNDKDLLILWDGSKAGEIVYGIEGALSSTMAKIEIISDKVDKNYLTYFLIQSEPQIQSNTIGMGIPHVNGEELKNLKVYLPSLDEQCKISQFLDQKTEQIDSIIEKKQNLLLLLEEKKKAVINEAVTKGLNPNVPMTDSGIEWIGEIPEGWKIKKMKYFLNLSHGHQFRENDFTDDGINVVKITQLKADGSLDLNNASCIDIRRGNLFNHIMLKEGDILMALTGGTIGKIIMVPKIGNQILLQNYRVGNFFPKNEQILLKSYLFWMLSSDSFLAQMLYLIRETGQPNVGKEDIDGMWHCIPPLEEQETIINFLFSELSKFKEVQLKVSSQIEKLKEYRQSIISEAVTGKIDVSNYN